MRQAEEILRTPSPRIGGFGFGVPNNDNAWKGGMKGGSKGSQRHRQESPRVQGNPYAEENDQDVIMEDPPRRRGAPATGEPAAEPAPGEGKGQGKGRGNDYSRPLGGGIQQAVQGEFWAPFEMAPREARNELVVVGFPEGSRKPEMEDFVKHSLERLGLNMLCTQVYVPGIRARICMIKLASAQSFQMFMRSFNDASPEFLHDHREYRLYVQPGKTEQERQGSDQVRALAQAMREAYPPGAPHIDVQTTLTVTAIWVGTPQVLWGSQEGLRINWDEILRHTDHTREDIEGRAKWIVAHRAFTRA